MAFKKLSVKQPKAATKPPQTGESPGVKTKFEYECCICGGDYTSCPCDKSGAFVAYQAKKIQKPTCVDCSCEGPPPKPSPVKVAAGMPPDDNTDTPLLVGPNNQLENGKMYVKLFHGRNKPDEQLDDWGFEGPTFGPLDYFQNTYNCHPRGGYYDGLYEELIEIEIFNDLYVYDGKYYGDISVFIHQEEGK